MAIHKAPGVYVIEQPTVAPIVGVGTSTPAFIGVYDATVATAENVVEYCTNFTEFAKKFGGYTDKVAGQNTLAIAVRGFFTNGGSGCYVVRVKSEGAIDAALAALEAYDDVAMVAAPGVPADIAAPGAIDKIVAHCAQMGDRIAILDAPNVPIGELDKALPPTASAPYTATDFAALYAPWLVVVDPNDPDGKKELTVPPSGHIAGIYARTDATRGVHKAPANEVVRGILRLSQRISRAQQEKINLVGGNCIRNMDGANKVWGARTLAGDGGTRAAWKYVPIRRLMCFLAKSIDHGTQWAVFEPNGEDLWAKLVRNIGSFLEGAWAQGMLAGTSPQEAFYVKCDAENNPPDERAKGYLYIDVGVAVLYPAEFVEIRIQHQSSLAK
ncbi:MAG: phage tail sheath family protein [Deltaproteobacteria bacterium]|nr:phage tail sheath family protein [Deltaproteobacteria bacterium]MCW5803091.1 phage tail sheath family protein [Deltaproteobacteria bacterium]